MYDFTPKPIGHSVPIASRRGYSYEIHPTYNLEFHSFRWYNKCMATSRYPPPSRDPVSNVWIDGVENNNQVAENLRDNSADADPLGESVHRGLFRQLRRFRVPHLIISLAKASTSTYSITAPEGKSLRLPFFITGGVDLNIE
jgi:hypothetical protein